MTGLKRIAQRLLPASLLPQWRRSFSQEGEDIVLCNYFGDSYQGIYVDVGAHDPQKWSNTKKLVERGWWGLNIDPRPGVARKFAKHRPRDITIEAAIDIGSSQPLSYWIFAMEPRWNCLSDSEPVATNEKGSFRPTSRLDVPIISVSEALDRAKLDHVDLLNLDIEGGEEQILRSWPWEHMIPKAICVEIIGAPAAETATSGLTNFLATKNLVFAAQLFCSVIYIERSFLASRYPTDSDRTHFRRPCLSAPPTSSRESSDIPLGKLADTSPQLTC